MNDYYLTGTPLRIGNTPQLLVDDYMVEDCWKLTRRVGTVVKHPGNPILVKDKPWESDSIGHPCGVLHDEQTGKYRMWYVCTDRKNFFTTSSGIIPADSPGYYVAYAESDDGVNWTKPVMPEFPFGGHDATNIVFLGRNNAWGQISQVFLNPDASDPEKRFGMVYTGIPDVNLAWSADGIHWRAEPECMYPLRSDGANHVLWVPEQKKWYFYLRPKIMHACGTRQLPEGFRHVQRRYGLTVSDDLRTWTEPRTVLYGDEREGPDINGFCVFRRHGLFIALYTVMHMEDGKGETQTYLATSRDGFHWEKTWDRAPFIDNGPAGSFDHGWVEVAGCRLIERGDDLWFYYMGMPRGQDGGDSDPAMGLCRVKRDRFIGHEAGSETGYLLTRQFTLEGNRLTINCEGVPPPYRDELTGIRVAVVQAPDLSKPLPQNEAGVPGYTLEDCDQILTDNPEHVVTWNGSPDLGPLVGKPVYLRFQMRLAVLYGFTVTRGGGK